MLSEIEPCKNHLVGLVVLSAEAVSALDHFARVVVTVGEMPPKNVGNEP